jgi:hypothetical protein
MISQSAARVCCVGSRPWDSTVGLLHVVLRQIELAAPEMGEAAVVEPLGISLERERVPVPVDGLR